MDGEQRGPAFALLATMQAAFNASATVTSVTGPQIADDLGLSRSGLVWTNAAFLLSFSGLLILGGRLADLLGWRRAFTTGTSLFALASLWGALAPGLAWMLPARLGQGAGAALAAPAAMALLGAVFGDGRSHRRAVAAWGGLSGVGAGSGTMIAGVAATWASWRWAFAVLALVGITAARAAPARLPTGPEPVRVRVDALGALLVTGGLASLSYGFVAAGDDPWGSAIVWVPLVVGAALLASFAAAEALIAVPLVPLRFLASLRRALGVVTAMLPPAAGVTTAVLLSLYFQDVLGWSVLETAAGFLPYTVGLAAGSLVSGPLTAGVGARWSTTAGLVLMTIGMAWLGQLTTDSSYLGVVVPGLAVLQVGAGISVGGSIVAVTDDVEPEQAALAGSVVNTSMLIGATIGLALLASLANSRTEALTGVTPEQAATSGYVFAFRAAAIGFAVAAVAAAAGLRRDRGPADAATRPTEVEPPSSKPPKQRVGDAP